MPKESLSGKKPTSRRYSPEKAAAVRMVRALRAELGTEQGTVSRVARQLGYVVPRPTDRITSNASQQWSVMSLTCSVCFNCASNSLNCSADGETTFWSRSLLVNMIAKEPNTSTGSAGISTLRSLPLCQGSGEGSSLRQRSVSRCVSQENQRRLGA